MTDTKEKKYAIKKNLTDHWKMNISCHLKWKILILINLKILCLKNFVLENQFITKYVVEMENTSFC